MHTTTPHGVDGCHCEDCLGLRIWRAADLAKRERPLVSLWDRQRRFRVRLAADLMRRRVS